MWSRRNLSRSTLTTACEQLGSCGIGPLVSGWSLLGSADAFDVELAGSVKPVDAVLLLVTNPLSIPPGLGAGPAIAVQGVRVPPDSAELGDEVRLPGIRVGELSAVTAVRPRQAVRQTGLMLCEAGRVLLVVVAVPDLGLQDAVRSEEHTSEL